jgi:glycine oxidase
MVADVTVVGTGVIALTAAIELADRGLHVRIVGTTHAGNASAAAGGILAPSVGRDHGPAHNFAVASRDRYPEFVAALVERSGRAIPLNRNGVLELASDVAHAEELRQALEPPSRWLDAAELRAMEPALAPAVGGVLHPNDGAVEPLALLDALRIVVARHNRISAVREDVVEVHVSELGCNVLTDAENRLASDRVVLAAGAWSPLIAGVGTAPERVQPVRGQMLAFRTEPPVVSRVVFGGGGYLIPKSDRHTIAGSTMEHAGFDATPTDGARAELLDRATSLCPALRDAQVSAQWAGLRPVTPDLLPIIGPDPERPRLLYSCGHSKNGILLAPLSAEVIADLATDVAPRWDLSRFLPGRT